MSASSSIPGSSLATANITIWPTPSDLKAAEEALQTIDTKITGSKNNKYISAYQSAIGALKPVADSKTPDSPPAFNKDDVMKYIPAFLNLVTTSFTPPKKNPITAQVTSLNHFLGAAEVVPALQLQYQLRLAEISHANTAEIEKLRSEYEANHKVVVSEKIKEYERKRQAEKDSLSSPPKSSRKSSTSSLSPTKDEEAHKNPEESARIIAIDEMTHEIQQLKTSITSALEKAREILTPSTKEHKEGDESNTSSLVPDFNLLPSTIDELVKKIQGLQIQLGRTNIIKEEAEEDVVILTSESEEATRLKEIAEKHAIDLRINLAEANRLKELAEQQVTALTTELAGLRTAPAPLPVQLPAPSPQPKRPVYAWNTLDILAVVFGVLTLSNPYMPSAVFDFLLLTPATLLTILTVLLVVTLISNLVYKRMHNQEALALDDVGGGSSTLIGTKANFNPGQAPAPDHTKNLSAGTKHAGDANAYTFGYHQPGAQNTDTSNTDKSQTKNDPYSFGY